MISQKNKFYLVTYDGLFDDGVSVVEAASPEGAIELVKESVKEDNGTAYFETVSVEEIHGPILYKGTVY